MAIDSDSVALQYSADTGFMVSLLSRIKCLVVASDQGGHLFLMDVTTLFLQDLGRVPFHSCHGDEIHLSQRTAAASTYPT